MKRTLQTIVISAGFAAMLLFPVACATYTTIDNGVSGPTVTTATPSIYSGSGTGSSGTAATTTKTAPMTAVAVESETLSRQPARTPALRTAASMPRQSENHCD